MVLHYMIALKQEWLAEAISCTCEVMVGNKPARKCHAPTVEFCEKPTVAAYPAMGGGWMALCERHARKHLPGGAYRTDELIAKGATWK
jgi:hypothetical protein